MFERLEESALALWVGESLWGYPLMLSLHVVGLSVIVGLFVVRDLRLLGLFSGMDVSAIVGVARIGWLGLFVNASSGFALFSSQATFFVESAPFLIKIAAILCAVVCGVILQRSAPNDARPAAGHDDSNVVASGTRTLAVVSILLWLTAITAGRLIAYL